MEKETYRKNLIKLLKTSKIYYINVFNEIEEYRLKEDVEKELNDAYENFEVLKTLDIWSCAFGNTSEIPQVNFGALMSARNQLIHKAKEKADNTKTVDIRDHYSIDKIADELSKIGEDDDEYYYYKYSKLKELKDARRQGSYATLKYIQTNTKK